MIHNGKKVLDGTLQSIQANYGNDTIRLRLEDPSVLASVNGIEKASDQGNYQEVRLTNGSDPQQLLSELAGRTRINLFEIASPSLHDIFVRIARPEADAS